MIIIRVPVLRMFKNSFLGWRVLSLRIKVLVEIWGQGYNIRVCRKVNSTFSQTVHPKQDEGKALVCFWVVQCSLYVFMQERGFLPFHSVDWGKPLSFDLFRSPEHFCVLVIQSSCFWVSFAAPLLQSCLKLIYLTYGTKMNSSGHTYLCLHICFQRQWADIKKDQNKKNINHAYIHKNVMRMANNTSFQNVSFPWSILSMWIQVETIFDHFTICSFKTFISSIMLQDGDQFGWCHCFYSLASLKGWLQSLGDQTIFK